MDNFLSLFLLKNQFLKLDLKTYKYKSDMRDLNLYQIFKEKVELLE